MIYVIKLRNLSRLSKSARQTEFNAKWSTVSEGSSKSTVNSERKKLVLKVPKNAYDSFTIRVCDKQDLLLGAPTVFLEKPSIHLTRQRNLVPGLKSTPLVHPIQQQMTIIHCSYTDVPRKS